MTIQLFIGIFVGLIITWLLLKLEGRKSKPKPEATQLLTIEDCVIPELLPLFKNHSVDRGVTINDTHIIMTWDHANCESRREYLIHTITSKEDFIKTWRKEEVGFYLRYLSVFGKPKYKKRAKK